MYPPLRIRKKIQPILNGADKALVEINIGFPLQYCKVISFLLIKINGKKKKVHKMSGNN